jgi:hypothetical protein
MDVFTELALERIKQAIADREFDGLPGKGQPLPPDALSAVSPELRLTYKVLKNARLVPPEVQILRDMDELRRRYDAAGDEEERRLLRRRLRFAETHYRILREKNKKGR